MRQLILSAVLVLFTVVAGAQIKFVSATFEQALAMGKSMNRQLIIDVCMGDKDAPQIATLFEDKALSNYINRNFYAVRIDMQDRANKDFSNHLHSLMYPCLVFYTNNGEQLESSNWFTIEKQGASKLLEMAKISMENAAIKRVNTRAIEFRDLDFKQALEVAKSEGKMLFVDNYISWSRPCKLMQNDVFTLNKVADFYNQHFVSIKLDADKDPYKVAKSNGVQDYPAYLYFAADGTLITSEEGTTSVNGFIAHGENALAEYANNDEILFNAVGSLDEAIALARNEGKPLFINVSATWCGPCKQIKATTFKEPAVAKYHNDNYINIYVETDKLKEFARELKDKYNYNAFPTFVFADKDGNMTHKFVGAGISGSEFIKHSIMGVENSGLTSYNVKYNSGERGSEFVKEYISILGQANESEKAGKVTADFLTDMTLEELLKEDNFNMFRENVKDIDARVAQLFILSYNLFEQKYAKIAERQRADLWYTKARSFVTAGDTPILDKEGFKAFNQRVKGAELPKDMKDDLIHVAKVNNAEMMSDWGAYLKLITAEYKDSGNSHLAALYNQSLRIEQRCDDVKIRLKMAELLEEAIVLAKEEAKIEQEKAAKMKAESGGRVTMGMSMSSPSMYIQAVEKIIPQLRESK